MRSTAVLVVAALLLSGCASKPEPTDESDFSGKTESRIIDPGASAGSSSVGDGGRAEAADGNGEIRGRIADDAELAVPGALVSLLGTEHSGVSDVNGSFRFTNITPGSHTLRVVADQYRVHEGSLEVVADRITEVRVLLVPANDRGPGYRPHIHDYWGTATELLLMDAALDWGKYGTYAQNYGAPGEVLTEVYQPNNGNWWMYFGITPANAGAPPIILPGTAAMRITVSWSSADANVDSFMLGYHGADTKTYSDNTYTNGVESTVDIDAEETDNGHQAFSLWGFRIKPTPRTAPPQTITGPIHVKMILVKGTVPAEPAHEDFWEANTTYVVRDENLTFTPSSTYVGGCGSEYQKVYAEAGRLVPPGASRMRIKFSWAAVSPLTGVADGTYGLWWKPANLPPLTPLSEYVTVEPTRKTASSAEFDIPLAAQETDAFYQTSSNWIFYFKRTDVPNANGICATNVEKQATYRLGVVVEKDPAYT